MRRLEFKGFPESTCFFRDIRGSKDNYYYKITITKARTVGCYGEEEVRFNPMSSVCKVEP